MDVQIGVVLMVLGVSAQTWVITSVGIVIALVILGFVIIRFARTQLVDRSSGLESGGFTLQELREMRAQGRISVEEYEAARQIILGHAATPGSGAGDEAATAEGELNDR